ncbi:MAG: hypothetical protein ACRC14_07385 [Paracoccaceae bacterium]
MTDQETTCSLADTVEVTMAVQVAAVRLLEAEMVALARMMPGIGVHSPTVPDAEIEQGFDNMPV